MSPSEFERYRAEGFTRIPVSREIVADLDTPLSTYLKLADAPYTFLLESVQGGEKWGRHSIIGLPCRQIVRVYEHELRRDVDGVEVERCTVDDPFGWIERFQSGFRVPEVAGLPPITGGLVGYFAYDAVRYVETRLGPSGHPDPLGNPDILLMVADELVVFDNLFGKLTIIVLADADQPDAYQQAAQRLDVLHGNMRKSLPSRRSVRADVGMGDACVSDRPPSGTDSSATTPTVEADFVSGFTENGYKAAVETIRRYIRDGECMQVVLSQRLSVPFQADALDLYRALRTLNPSPYMFHLNLGDHHVVGASPEILVRLDEGEVTVRPLAGTRPRGADEAADRALEQSLLADEKELAEHLMLIDLGRNDIGRIATIGSVEVTDRFNVERYSHVMHIVSNVVGQLKSGMSAIDVLRATLPAGTLSGAPKVRAMEIIDELEPVKRGIYGGAVGYLSWNGNMDTAIAIRTAVIHDGHLTVQAGAGIVHDSDPDTEWQETMSKARAIVRAVALAEQGFDDTAPIARASMARSGQ